MDRLPKKYIAKRVVVYSINSKLKTEKTLRALQICMITNIFIISFY